jgi:ssDNA-binding Zn-finger/Zn-ribbon topoisomerase 1
MALRVVPKPDDQPDREPPPVAVCPVCEGKMEVVYDRHHQKVVVCVDCQSGLTVPAGAWEIARIKRESKWMPKP